MKTAERLNGYYNFSPDVVDTVAEFAEFQAGFETYKDFFGAVGIPEVQVIPADGKDAFTVVDVRPDEYDEQEAMIMHLPMANPLDANQLFQVATIAGTNPNMRVIAFGNPSSGAYRGERFNLHWREALIGGDLTPLIGKTARYRERSGAERTHEIGYSYGALKAVVSAARLSTSSVVNITAVEPVTPTRSVLRLGKDFASTDKALKAYTEAPNLQIYRDARDDAVSLSGYMRGLVRPTNLAIARALAKTNFEDVLVQAMDNHQATATLAWGSDSELADDESMQAMTRNLTSRYSVDDIQAIRLKEEKHALANDVHLHAAIILEGLKKAGQR